MHQNHSGFGVINVVMRHNHSHAVFEGDFRELCTLAVEFPDALGLFCSAESLGQHASSLSFLKYQKIQMLSIPLLGREFTFHGSVFQDT